MFWFEIDQVYEEIVRAVKKRKRSARWKAAMLYAYFTYLECGYPCVVDSICVRANLEGALNTVFGDIDVINADHLVA